jgi:hypothetical protein
VQNLKVLVDFEVRPWITKKSLVVADASPSIHASIHRSIVSPTALLWAKAVWALSKSALEESFQVSTYKIIRQYALFIQLATRLRRSFTSREGMTRYILQPVTDVALPDGVDSYCFTLCYVSVADPWHFGVDPDPRMHASD